MTTTTDSSSQPITLPQGGGAVRGIGETFQANAFTGTGNFTIPIPTSPGRAGFGPQLSLQYSTGSGNGSFGIGWQLSIPRVTRKTEKGLPRYDDRDVFVMSGAEDLVPIPPKQTTLPETSPPPPDQLIITRYRPRTEGLFARIEKWVKGDDIHWRAITKDNVTSIYGLSNQARIVNPEDPTQIYEWLLEETFDAKGNHILYEYAQEDPELRVYGINEQNRRYQSQRYIRRIFYGNAPEALDAVGIQRSNGKRYLFEVLFDYKDLESDPAKAYKFPPIDPEPQPEVGEGASQPPIEEFDPQLEVRPDSFSSYRSGFEIRTLRRCERVLMIHHFEELAISKDAENSVPEQGENLVTAIPVKSIDFHYGTNTDTLVSFLEAVTVRGYRWDKAEKSFLVGEMPPIAFKYSAFEPQKQRYQSVQARGDDLPPRSLGHPDIALVDLDGNGLPDVLDTFAGEFRYWRNLGNGEFDRPQRMPQIPAGVMLSQPGVSFADMGGDGQADLLVLNGPTQGFYETTPETTWKTFKRIPQMPSVSLADPSVRLVDLTGDGLSDVLMTRDRYFLWFQCLGEQGYGQPQLVPKEDDHQGLVFNDSSGRVRLADMTGDGLNDIVLVHNGSIEYWPNLGYGRFGKRVKMANAPHVEGQLDPARLFLADLDGSGCADLVYVGFNQVQFWFNRSGNGWSDEQVIRGTPSTVNMSAIQFADLYGLGTSTLVWSKDYGQGQVLDSHYKVLDFCGGVKPYLLVEMDNNLGATTRVQYGSSSQHYLEDEKKGEPWATKLPFPVQVVDKVETIDHVSKTKLVTTYSYHHGYFDGREREFRGFGRVDQLDTEEFEDFKKAGLHQDGAGFANTEQAFHVPPVLTKTWFHTGAYLTEKALMDRYEAEYGKQVGGMVLPQLDSQAFDLGDHGFEWLEPSSQLSYKRFHEAHRSLRGSVLRREVYSLDKVEKAFLPYIVTESRYRVRQLQAKGENAHGVYLTLPLQSISYHYERNLADPRIAHEMTLEVDEFGNVLKSVAIAYPRRGATTGEQSKTLVTYTENRVANKPNDKDTDPDWYLIGVPVETQIFEITGISPGAGEPFKVTDFFRIDQEQKPVGYCTALIIDYEATPTAGQVQRRRIEWVKTFYRPDAQADTFDPTRLDPENVESLALPCDSLKLAFTTGLLRQIYGDKISDAELNALLEQQGKYIQLPGDYKHWWIPSGRQKFDPTLFYLPVAAKDPFDHESKLRYDRYGLAVTEAEDVLQNVITAEIDYRVLQPFRVTDPNLNRSQVAFDALGLVVGTAVMGKAGETVGDSLATFNPDLSDSDIQAFFDADNPRSLAIAHLGTVTTRIIYDLDSYRRDGTPVCAAAIARETHLSDLATGQQTKVQLSFVYSDGFGRELQTKVQAEPGETPLRDINEQLIRENGKLKLGNVDLRWVGTGRKVYNNKGKPVKQYEPFFSSTHRYELELDLVEWGVTPILFYDPLERVVCTLHPNHTYEKVVFDPWQQTTWDVNDTVRLNPTSDDDVKGFFEHLPEAVNYQTWYEQRINGDAGAPEQAAARKTEAHAGTPTVAHLDTLGRVFLTVANNGKDDQGDDILYETQVALDIEGNDLAITDPRKIQAFIHRFDIAGRKLSIDSKDAGLKRILLAVDGQPMQTWDANGHQVKIEYDQLRRPVKTLVTSSGTDPALTQVMIYGEKLGSIAPNTNHRGKVYATLDSAGLALNLRYDFKGNLEQSARRLATDYQNQPNWQGFESVSEILTDAGDLLEAETFYASSQFDALNRVTQSTAPDHDRVDWAGLSLPTLQNGSVYRFTYNEASLLEKVVVDLRPLPGTTAVQTQTFVDNINYNAKGQRTYIKYGNGVTTTYDYYSDTFRLHRVLTRRNGTERLQDLHYTYDPVGNITQIEDRVFPVVFHSNERICPTSRYVYDPLYRLVKAFGREHVAMDACHQQQSGKKHTEIIELLESTGTQPVNNGQALRNYVEIYEYDPSGNLTKVHHRAGQSDNWTREQNYVDVSNRLSESNAKCTGENPFEYPHDANGNILKMPHLDYLTWDYADRLILVSNNGNGGASSTAFYTYDAGGQRVRKVIETGGNKSEERIYLGGFEIHRSYNEANGNLELERQTLHVMDDQRRIALVETRTQGSDDGDRRRTRYQMDNHLGSSLLEVNEDAEVISYEEFYPYGGTAYLAGKNEAEVKRKRYRYSGKERDDETGLYYYGARYYAPWLGRWMSCDPAGAIDSTNLFQFSNSNPIIYVDPEGRAIRYFQILFLGAEPTDQELEEYRADEAKHNKAFLAVGALTAAGAAVAVVAAPAAVAAAGEAVTVVTTGIKAGATGIGMALAGETVLDAGNVAFAGFDVLASGGSPSAFTGLLASMVDLGLGPSPLGEMNTVRVVEKNSRQKQTPKQNKGSKSFQATKNKQDSNDQSQQKRGRVSKASPPATKKLRLPTAEVSAEINRSDRALSNMANKLKKLDVEQGGVTIEIALAEKNGKRFLVAGINSGAGRGFNEAQLAQLKSWGINVAPQQHRGEMKRAPHAEENIAAFLQQIGARGLRWSQAVVGRPNDMGNRSYICHVCQSIIRSVGGTSEPRP